MAPILRAQRAIRMSFKRKGNSDRHPLAFASMAVTTAAASTQSPKVGLTQRPVRSIGPMNSCKRMENRCAKLSALQR